MMPIDNKVIKSTKSLFGIKTSVEAEAGMMQTQTPPFIRDSFNLDQARKYILLALAPCIFMALYNVGYQANIEIAIARTESAYGWRGSVMSGLGVGYDLDSFWSAVIHGALFFLPVLVVTIGTALIWETIFVSMRNRERQSDSLMVGLLFALCLPASVQLWQVALGISFAVIFGREIFGGTGKYFLNPVLVGLAFLHLTYPSDMISEVKWTVVDAFTSPTYLELAGRLGPDNIDWLPTVWLQTFIGITPGAFGVTSTLACIIAGGFLLYTRVISSRIVFGILIGMVTMSLIINEFENPNNAFIGLSPHWHLTLGSFAFGTVFLATDPTSAAMTDRGRLIYGLLIGAMVVIIRVLNSGHPDGIVFAILFANIFAPFIDYLEMWANIRRRAKRDARKST